MARSRKNGGIIGRKNDPKAISASGLWTGEDSAYQRNPGIGLDDSTYAPQGSLGKGSVDPYYDNTIIQLGDTDYADHVMKDKSQYGWDAYYAQTQYYSQPLATYFGPRYTDWSTHFHENTYYTVNDYANLRLGAGTFTVEFWVKLMRNDATEYYIMGKGSNAGRTAGTGWVVYVNTAGNIGFYDSQGNVSVESSVVLTQDVWYHVAFTRDSVSNMTVFINGTNRGTVANATGNFTDTSPMYIGVDRIGTSTTWFGGNITDIKISNIQQYAINFARPTTYLNSNGAVFMHSMKTPHHDNIVANQITGATITVSSSYIARYIDGPFLDNSVRPLDNGYHSAHTWDGSNYIKLYDVNPSSTALRVGTSAFTIECWLYCGSNQVQAGVLGKGTGNSGAGGSGWSFYINGGGYLAFDDTASTLTAATNPITYCGWYHVAAVREGTGANQFKMYVNGVRCATGTVATNYTGADFMNVFASRNAQYTHRGHMCGIRFSNVARYMNAFTDNFNPITGNLGTFIDSSMTSDANTLFLVGTSGTTKPTSTSVQWMEYGSTRNAMYRNGNEIRYSRPVNSRFGNSFASLDGGSQYNIVATTSSSAFSFSTGDFAIEFWFMDRYGFDDITTRRYLFDTRTLWNDTGIAVCINGWRKFEVIGNNRTLLNDTATPIINRRWHHICVQRVNGNLALYIDGRKKHETRYTGAIDSPGNQMTILNSTYSSIQYSNGAAGWISDLRVIKGVGAYYQGLINPETFLPPSVPLTATANTTFFLSAAQTTFKDSSASNNIVTVGNRNAANFGSAWDVYQSATGPYKGVEFDMTKQIAGDTYDGTSWGYLKGAFVADNTYPDYSFITRQSSAWTIEFFMFPPNTNPASVGNIWTYLYTATTTGHEGFKFVNNYNAGTGVWGDLTFYFYTAHNSAAQTLSSAKAGAAGQALNPHGWNHIAIVYDPTKSNQVGMFINGVLTAARGAFNPGQKVWNTYQLQNNGAAGIGGVRISNVARYNNDVATCTVPTQQYTLDANTVTMVNCDGPFINKAMQMQIWAYGPVPNYKVKKFGKASIKISNKDTTTLIDRLNIGYSNWDERTWDVYYGDFTIEMWANWWDLASGGKNNFATYGNCLFHFQNWLYVGVNSSGVWWCKLQSGGGSTPTVYQTQLSTVTAATVASGNFDHIAMVRRSGNYYFYINGIEQGSLFASNFGTYTAGTGPTTNFNDNWYNVNTFSIGCDYNSDANTTWSGNVQDIRVSTMARYTSKLVNNIPVMVHVGTTKPALPTGLHPTK